MTQVKGIVMLVLITLIVVIKAKVSITIKSSGKNILKNIELY